MFNEHLIPLAETLDAARIEANKHVHTEGNIYNQISPVLKDVLYFIAGDKLSAQQVYASLLDGCSVRVALAQFKGELV